MISPLFRFQKFDKFLHCFLENLRHQKDILKSTDFYIVIAYQLGAQILIAKRKWKYISIFYKKDFTP